MKSLIIVIAFSTMFLTGCGPRFFHTDPTRNFEQDKLECEWEARSRYGNQFAYGDPYGAMSAYTIIQNTNLCLRTKGWYTK